MNELPKPWYHDEYSTLYRGDALDLLRHLPDASVDAIITDPPYSSGGSVRSDRTAKPSAKYISSGGLDRWAEFSGDNRDGRGWAYWCALWLNQCLRLVRPHGYLLMFTDWRQLPLATDALQAGGWVWRGIVAWDKTEGARPPHTGYFRHQCEYIVWGTRGTSRPAKHGGPWAGCFRVPVRQKDKHHMTGKPTALMEELVQVVPPGGVILDPFAGSGTTLVAARLHNRKGIGFEQDEAYCRIAASRLEEGRPRDASDPQKSLLAAGEGAE